MKQNFLLFGALILISRMAFSNNATPCVERALAALNLFADDKTEPKLIVDILENIKLHDNNATKLLFGNMLTTPTALRPMLSDVREGLRKRSGAFMYIFCQAQQDGLLNQIFTTRMVHTMFVLNTINQEMLRSTDYRQHIYNFTALKREQMRNAFGVERSVIENSGGLFGMIGEMNVDDIFANYRKDLKVNNRRDEQKSIANNLVTDYLSAIIAQDFIKDQESYITALILSATVPDHISIDHSGRIKIFANEEWLTLFQALCLNISLTQPRSDLLAALMLTPSLANAPSENYLDQFFLAVWFSFNATVLQHENNSTHVDNRMSKSITTMCSTNTEACAIAYLRKIAPYHGNAAKLLNNLENKRDEIDGYFRYLLGLDHDEF